MTDLIDSLSKERNRIFLVGCSAGASYALNAFAKNKNKIHKVISVCGRLRKGGEQGYRSFEQRTKSSKLFKDSVLYFEQNEQKISPNKRKKILTVSALWDELVPYENSIMDGATNIKVPTSEHLLSIAYALRFEKRVIDFIQS